MKKIFTLLFIALMGMSYTMQAQDAEPNAIYAAFTTEDEEWAPSYDGVFMVENPITVDNYDGYFIIKGWSGVEGNDLKIAYDADDNVTALTTITNGTEAKPVKSGYTPWLYTGLTGEGEWVSVCFYVGTGYSYAASSADEGGYALLSLYASDGNNSKFIYYYLWWDQSFEQIQTAAFTDTETLAAYVDLPMMTMDAIDDLGLEDEASLALYMAAGNVIGKAFALNELVEAAAQKAMTETGSYESPINDEAMAELEAVMEEYKDLLHKVVNADYEKDLDILLGYQAAIEPTWDNPENYTPEALAAAEDIDFLVLINFSLIEDAAEAAETVTGFYYSPITEETIAELDAALAAFKQASGIAGIATDGAAARYYDLNGVEVANPTAGKIYIRVAGSKATKALVK